VSGRLRIGTRGSALALWQAEDVRAKLAATGIEAELVVIRTAGDRDRETPLSVMGGKGVFIKELEDALLENRIDLAVHSMKDVPTALPVGLGITAICARADVHDALVSRAGLRLGELPRGARIGTSSLRRRAQLWHYRADLEMVEIRGNVDTRLRKLDGGDCEALVLAQAGLERLGAAGRITEAISTDVCLPAAGQGAIGIESRVSDESLRGAISLLNDVETRLAVDAERAALAGLEGGCQMPVGVWAHVQHRELVVEACVLSPDGSESMRVRRVGSPLAGEEIGATVAEVLRSGGADRLLRAASAQPRK
jgi:hydroxymethylbilane synthase